MNSPGKRTPPLTPSFHPSAREAGQVETSAESPAPHRGWNSRGYLPHWDHPGMIQSLNFRLADSLPTAILERWKNELRGQPDTEIAREIYGRAEKYLDAGRGECWLRQPAIAQVVQTALLYFDGERYRLLAWCVMPNHVHALMETRTGFPLGEILHAWKSFTAKAANKILKRQGEFWQRDYFDRYIRNAEHYAAAIGYIEENPVKAGLARVKTEWDWSSARIRQAGDAGRTGSADF